MGSKAPIGFIGLLAIAFIVLKLIGVITWSWIWVLSPIWISVVAICIFLVAFLAGFGHLVSLVNLVSK